MRPLGESDPRVIGRYQVLAEWGRGAVGRVLLGRAPDGRLVAVTQVRDEFAAQEGFRERFGHAVTAAARVAGPRAAAVVDAGPDAPTPWLASDFVPGVTLRDAAGALPEESVVFLAAELAAALAEVHRAGLVHRDLNPANVVLTDDGLRVTGFGIALATDVDNGTGNTGWRAGSPGYMSPEQAVGQPPTAASDLFSLGSVLVMACTGRGPFDGPSTAQTLYRVAHTEPDLSAVPERLRPIIHSCLDKDPAGRPTAADLLDGLGLGARPPWPSAVRELIALRHNEVARIAAVPWPVPAPRAGRRRVVVVAAAGIVVAVAAVVGILLSVGNSAPEGCAEANDAFKTFNASSGEYAVRAKKLATDLDTAARKATDPAVRSTIEELAAKQHNLASPSDGSVEDALAQGEELRGALTEVQEFNRVCEAAVYPQN